MKLTAGNYDVRGMTVRRMFCRYLGGKLRPLWWFGNGLEFKHILALATRHYLGYPIAYMTTRYDRQWQGLLRNWRRVRAGMSRSGSTAAEQEKLTE